MIKTGEKMELREQEHNYEVVETDDGFEIIPIEKHRESVKARLLENGFWDIESSQINYKDINQRIFSEDNRRRNSIERYTPNSFISNHIYPLFSFSPLLHQMVSILYITWDKMDDVVKAKEKYEKTLQRRLKGSQKQRQESLEKLGNSMAKSQIIHKWAIKTTIKTLSKKASIIAKEKHNILNPEIVKLHRLLYSEAGGSGYWGNIYDILKDRESNKYLIKDLIHFKSARCLLLTEDCVGKNFPDISSTDWKNFDWKSEIADMGNPYVRKTVSNFPSGLPYYKIGVLRRLNTNYLEEPITSRIRMLAYDTMVSSHAYDYKNYYRVIKNSTDDEIKKAVRMYLIDNGEKCDLRRTVSVKWAMHYMFDYCQKSEKVANINMIGLYKRAKKYHQELDEEQRMRDIEWEVKNEEFLKKEVALPPFELPEDSHLSFLKTVKDIHDEGNKMHHCVSSYAEYALKGRSFLFHIDYNGEFATAEVDEIGRVVQVRGPRNTENSATKYGEKILSEWGKQFRKISKMIVDFSSPVYDYAFDEDIPF